MKTHEKKSIDVEEMKDFYRSSSAYQERMAKKGTEDWRQVFRQYVGQVLPYCRPSAEILDLGCGGGWSCLEFIRTRSDIKVTGLDLSAAAFRMGASRESGDIRFVEGNAMQLPFPNEIFDVVTSYAMLEHVPDVERALNEMVRVLRLGGTLIVCGPNMLSPLRIGRLMYKGVTEGHFHPDGRPKAALRMIWALFKKMLSKRMEFLYRQPMLDKDSFQGSDWDAIYLMNPVDLSRFARVQHLQILNRSSAGRLLGKVVSKAIPEFAGGVYFVAKKVVF